MLKSRPAKKWASAILLVLSGATSLDAQTNFTVLLNLGGGADGSYPQAGLTAVGSRLYGSILSDGSYGYGAVFGLDADGTNFAFLYSFSGLPYWIHGTNTDGANPRAQLVLAGSALYGTAPNGGTLGSGTIFRINTDGGGFTNLYNFTALDPTTQTNLDGARPYAGLVSAGNELYGTAFQGGRSGYGTIFRINTDGTGMTSLHHFAPFTGQTYYPSGDGAYPYASLILSGNTLYRTAEEGGDTGFGMVFAINTDGTGFANLHSFTSADYGFNVDGAWPLGRLLLIDNTLYGTTSLGGTSVYGTVFALTLTPPLAIAPAGSQMIVSWPTWAPNFTLQVTTNLSSGSWIDIRNATNTVGANYVFTNAMADNAMFFRLKGH